MNEQIKLLKAKINELFETKSKEFLDYYLDIISLFDEYFKKQAIDYINTLPNYPGIKLEKQEINLEELEKKLEEIYLLGMTEGLSENNSELLKVGAGISLELLPNNYEVNYAKENAGRLIQQIDSTTQKDIGEIISKGIEASLSINEIAKDIQKKFASYSLYRSTLIATQEVSMAYEQGKKQNFIENSKSLKITGRKRSVTQHDESVRESHRQNEKDGRILRDKVFSGTGTDTAPHGIWCRCYIQYSLSNPNTGLIYDDTIYQYDELQFEKFNENWGSLEDIGIKLSEKELEIQKKFNLLQEELHAIKGYTGNSSIIFKDGYKFGESNQMFQSGIQFLIGGLNKLPKYDGLVYSGYKVKYKSDYKYFGNLKVGNSFYFNEFISSSKTKNIAEEFIDEKYPVIFKIKSKKGIDIQDLSTNPTEKEVLFLPKTLFYVEKIEFQDNILKITLVDL